VTDLTPNVIQWVEKDQKNWAKLDVVHTCVNWDGLIDRAREPMPHHNQHPVNHITSLMIGSGLVIRRELCGLDIPFFVALPLGYPIPKYFTTYPGSTFNVLTCTPSLINILPSRNPSDMECLSCRRKSPSFF
jgi:hypothetical protein